MTAWWAEHAWLAGGLARHVRLVADDGAWASVAAGTAPAPGDVVLPGVVLPGLANAHSHAFHRALRGRTHAAGGDFWAWRDAMYAVAGVLAPDSYRRLARAVYAEMALAGVTAVGEFHYVHHRPDGTPYDEPNAMGHALRDAARDAGVRLTLLDTCYLTGGIGAPLTGVQRRFGDGDAAAWARRVTRFADDVRADRHVRVGAAVHSVRAVPPDEVAVVARWAAERVVPLHVHVSEQPAENEACLAAHGRTPTRVLADAGALGPRTTAVHAVHVTDDDVALLGGTGTTVCLCPTTERDLADGLAPAPALRAAGSPLALGSDQHAVVDLLEEARALEMHARLASGRRGVLDPAALVAALTADGHRALGGDGRLAVGAPADLVALRTDTVRTAGADPAQVVLAASAADVDTVVVGGEVVVRDGRHRLGDVGALLADVIAELDEAVARGGRGTAAVTRAAGEEGR